MSGNWTEEHIPDQRGRVAIVTGANTGLGFETARMLAERGAAVVLAVRDMEKGKRAAARITGDVTVQALDLTSMDSIRSAAADLRAAHPRIDLLINNAGVMYTPKQTTADGFELQFGTNHLGHFALTGLLLDRILPVPGSRVVTVSSTGHRIRAAIHFDDLQWERSYSRIGAYGQAKLANLMFTYELQQPARTARHHGRGRRPSRRVPHRTHPQRTRRASRARHLARAAAHPEGRDGCPAHAARGHRSGRHRRPVLRPRQPRGDPRLPEAGLLQPRLPRPGNPAAPVGRLRGAHRCDVRGDDVTPEGFLRLTVRVRPPVASATAAREAARSP